MQIPATVSRGVRNGDVIFKVNGENVNNLIGYHGETLEAVQYILNTIVREKVPAYRKKVYIDVENYQVCELSHILVKIVEVSEREHINLMTESFG
jgi:spoIIIJ-associated protein